MSFYYPWFLLALSAVAIPVIIHLFQFRRFKKVYFSNITFLEKIIDETQKQARLKHLLVLLSRILAIIMLVLAFARPFIPANDTATTTQQGNKVSIYVDNSFSMESGTSTGTLLDDARTNAREIAETFDVTDQFLLLTNDFEAKHQRFVSKDEFLAMLDEIDFSPAIKTTSEIINRQSGLFQEEDNHERGIAFILSDFQKNIALFDEAQPDSLTDFFLIPFQLGQRLNIFIDSVWIENPVQLAGQRVTISVKIYNNTDEDLQNQPARLYVNNTQRTVATLDINARSSAIAELTYTPDTAKFQEAWVEITDHPVTFDDRFYFSFTINDNIPVMIINQDSPNRFLNALLTADSTFIVQNVASSAIDFSMASSQNLIILNGIRSPGSGLTMELSRYVNQGGNLLIFPSENADIPAYNNLFQALDIATFLRKDTANTRVSSINELHPVYMGVFDRIPENTDLPVVNEYYVMERQTRGREENLLMLQNGNYFFISAPSGQGNVFVSAVPANDQFSNFTRHAIFVPTVYNIALQSASFYPLYYTINQDENIQIRNYDPASNELFLITGNQVEIIPERINRDNNIILNLHDQIKNDGNYFLSAGEEELKFLSFNYDRRESLLEVFSTGELSNIINNNEFSNLNLFEPGVVSMEKQMELLTNGRELWKLFLLLGILFLLAEVFLIRFLK